MHVPRDCRSCSYDHWSQSLRISTFCTPNIQSACKWMWEEKWGINTRSLKNENFLEVWFRKNNKKYVCIIETCRNFVCKFAVFPSREMWNIHFQYETSVSFKNLSQSLLRRHSKNSCILCFHDCSLSSCLQGNSVFFFFFSSCVDYKNCRILPSEYGNVFIILVA